MIGATIFLLVLVTLITKMVFDVQVYKKLNKQNEEDKLFSEEKIYDNEIGED